MATTARSPAQGMYLKDFEKFKPTMGLIVIQREDPPESSGSILLVAKSADTARKVPTPARVVRTGYPDRTPKSDRPIPLAVKEGDRVMVDAFAGHDIEIRETGARYVIVGEPEILCVIDEDVVCGTQHRTMPGENE